MEADDGLWVDAHDVQAPAVALQELSKEPQKDSTELLVLGEQVGAVSIRSQETQPDTGFPGTSATPLCLSQQCFLAQ